MCLCVFVCCFVFEFDTLLFGCIWLCVMFCWRLLCVCACMWESVSLSACGEPGGGTHLGGCSSTPRHAPSAPSGCGRTKPVHFHSHAPAGRILIIISPMMRHCDALHSRSLSQFLSFFLFLFLFFSLLWSLRRKGRKRMREILTWYCCLQKSVQFSCCKPNQSYFMAPFVASYRDNYTVCSVIPWNEMTVDISRSLTCLNQFYILVI